jgi:hypothetical protein
VHNLYFAANAANGCERAMNGWLRFFLPAAFLPAIFPSTVAAVHDEKKGHLNLYWENDIFAGTDGQYTNGFNVWWLSADVNQYTLPRWGETAVGYLPFINRPGVVRNLGLGFGQQIYTPDDITLRDPPEDDRPYAGWLYLAIAFHSKTEHRIDTFEFNLGVVGPPSLAEKTQRAIHRRVGGDRPRGWDHQLGTEPGLQAIYERRLRTPRFPIGGPFETDIIPHLGAGLGNIEFSEMQVRRCVSGSIFQVILGRIRFAGLWMFRSGWRKSGGNRSAPMCLRESTDGTLPTTSFLTATLFEAAGAWSGVRGWRISAADSV